MPLLVPSLAGVLSVSRISTELVNAKQEMSELYQHVLSSLMAQGKCRNGPWVPRRSPSFCNIELEEWENYEKPGITPWT